MNIRSAITRAVVPVLAVWFSGALPAPAFTLIVAPARYSVIQVAKDVLDRSPAVLVSYQGDAGAAEPVLHAWNGTEWVPVSLKDYREVNFLQRVPECAVLIGNNDVLPQALVEASSWSPRIERISELTSGALINDFGRILNWRPADWKWFAQRYNLKLTDEAEPRRRSSWFDQPGPLPDRPSLLSHPAPRPSAPEPAVQNLAPLIAEPAPPAEEAAPPVQDPAPPAEETAAPVEEPAPVPVDTVSPEADPVP